MFAAIIFFEQKMGFFVKQREYRFIKQMGKKKL